MLRRVKRFGMNWSGILGDAAIIKDGHDKSV